MRILLRLIVVVALGNFVCPSSVWAQSSQFSRGTTSSSQLSSSTTRSSSSSARTTGSSQTGSAANSQTSQASAIESGINSRIGQLMQGNDQGTRSARGAQDFVGADRGDVPNLMGYSNSSQSQRTTLSNRSRQSTANRSYRQGGLTSGRQRRSRTAATEVQPVLRLGFEYAAMASPTRTTELTAKLSHRSPVFSGTRIDLNDGVAILTGTAASDHARALAEQLLALEPGVRRVENRLTVVASGSSATGSTVGQPAQP